ncbi:MAG: class I tRNA ligase family protein, partial [Gammaproteobacteria bacterium]|nr:class I tRNA ligase family protein [Gammaproteobacteria bacterium]
TFDIHGGGQDLQFPHHENEIAQSCGATGKPFVNLWMHNGFVRLDDEKMSKSLDNFFTVREILKKYQAEVVRFFILSSHYRSPLNYSDANLNEAKSALTRLYTSLRNVNTVDMKYLDDYVQRFIEEMNDDFNTREAITLLHEITHELNKEEDKTSERARGLASTLKHLGGILGLLQDNPESFLTAENSDDGFSAGMINQLIEERTTAKQNKDYARADEIRDQLSEQGIIIEDSATGTVWRRS